MINCATYLIIAAHKNINAFMVAADLFELGKVLGNIEEMTITYDQEVELTLQRAGIILDKIREAYDTNGYIVSLVHLLQVEHGNIVERNIGVIQPYINKEVRIISTGEKWFLLDDFMRRLGWTVKTDEHRFIKFVE